MQLVRTALEASDYDIVLAEDLEDNDGVPYTMTLKSALDELLGSEYLLSCRYKIHVGQGEKKLLDFIGWTETKVIFCTKGMFYDDSLLSYVARNPPAA